MKDMSLQHYIMKSAYTNASAYKDYFQTLPDDIEELGKIICAQIIHPTVLMFPDIKLEKYFGPLEDYPEGRVKDEDEIFVTAAAMTAEIFRLDPRGFVLRKRAAERIAVSCRHASVLTAAVCKAKGIPCRCRAGFIDFRHNGSPCGDHWINQIWKEAEHRWQNFDASGYYEYESRFGFSQFDIPEENFTFAAQAWLELRSGRAKEEQYVYQDAKGTNGLDAALIYLFLDFHALMNDEILYTFRPKFAYQGISQIGKEQLEEIDKLAELMLDPDGCFDELLNVWKNNRMFRVMTSPLNEDF